MIKVANIVEEGKVGGPQVRIVNIAKFLQNKITTVVIMPNSNSHKFQLLCSRNQINFKNCGIDERGCSPTNSQSPSPPGQTYYHPVLRSQHQD